MERKTIWKADQLEERYLEGEQFTVLEKIAGKTFGEEQRELINEALMDYQRCSYPFKKSGDREALKKILNYLDKLEKAFVSSENLWPVLDYDDLREPLAHLRRRASEILEVRSKKGPDPKKAEMYCLFRLTEPYEQAGCGSVKVGQNRGCKFIDFALEAFRLVGRPYLSGAYALASRWEKAYLADPNGETRNYIDSVAVMSVTTSLVRHGQFNRAPLWNVADENGD